MNSFFDLTEDEIKRGRCETNYFHMYVNADIDTIDISKLDAKTRGTFMHEYLHYLQFINTVFGVSYGIIYNNFFSYCKKHFIENETIKIPLNILGDYPELQHSIDKYKNLKGSVSELPIEIARIEINSVEIENARKNNTGVQINAFESVTNEVHNFNFGYLCIIESMAHIFQSFFDPKAEHPQIPYKAVQLICRDYYPKVAEDPKMLFSICLCSLMYNNPAFGFFEILEIVRLNPRMNGQILYKHMLEESKVHHNGTIKSIKDIFLTYINDYQTNIESAISHKLKYYSDVLKSCKHEINQGESLLLKLLYESDITTKKSIDILLNYYGVPLVDSNTYTFMAKSRKLCSKNIDIALLRSLEMTINRFIPNIDRSKYPIYDPKCPLYTKCYSSLYAYKVPPFEMSEECLNKQWDKGGKCLMTESLKVNRVYGKSIIQDLLPPEMQ